MWLLEQNEEFMDFLFRLDADNFSALLYFFNNKNISWQAYIIHIGTK